MPVSPLLLLYWPYISLKFYFVMISLSSENHQILPKTTLPPLSRKKISLHCVRYQFSLDVQKMIF